MRLVAVLVVFFVVCSAPLWEIAPSTNDDLRMANTVREGVGAICEDLRDLSIHKGRPYFLNLLNLAPFAVDDVWFFRAWMVGWFALAGIVLGVLVARTGGGMAGGALAAACLWGLARNDFEFSPLSTVGMLTPTLVALVAAMVWFDRRLAAPAERRPRAWPALAAFAVALSTLEIYVVYAPLFVLLAWRRVGRPAAALRVSAPFLILAAAFAGFSMIWKALTPGSYAGAEVRLDTGVTDVARAALGLSAWSLPGMVAASAKYRHLLAVELGAPSPWSSLAGLLGLRAAWCAVSAAVLAAACKRLLPRPAPLPPAAAGTLLAAAGYAFVAPSIPLALTAQYRDGFLKGDYHGYMTTFLALAALCAAAGWFVPRLLRSGSRAARGSVAILAAAGWFGVLEAGYVTEHVSRYQGTIGLRHDLVRAWARSPAARGLAPGALVEAPSLYQPVLTASFEGPPYISDWSSRGKGYWSGFVSSVGGPSLRIVRRAPPGAPVGARLSFVHPELGVGAGALLAARADAPDRVEVFGGGPELALGVPIAGGAPTKGAAMESGIVTRVGSTLLVTVADPGPRGRALVCEGAELDVLGAFGILGRRIVARLAVAEAEVVVRGVGAGGALGRRVVFEMDPRPVDTYLVAEFSTIECERPVPLRLFAEGGEEVGRWVLPPGESLVGWSVAVERGPELRLELRSEGAAVPPPRLLDARLEPTEDR